MNSVEPIRDLSTLKDMQDYFKVKNKRNYVLFNVGIYSPMRISDILTLKVRDVRGKYIRRREKKTNKENKVIINNELRKILDDYIEDMNDYDYLFLSRQRNRYGVYSHITRQQVDNILKDAAREFHLEAIGCHSMRKTFGYHYYQRTKDLEILRKIFNHSNTGVTAAYIGITQKMKDNAIETFKY
ncbi:tyrosine-type recombinase/integrase [Vallitalea maricola]|uniref:Site-specific integrase n=1 Tax=Vallitalea maricola TaxID=3074433 RepID=A0ACB5UN06_9FIRM|nr:site-specific integrase [Vallitalea sp. AN17-2]